MQYWWTKYLKTRSKSISINIIHCFRLKPSVHSIQLIIIDIELYVCEASNEHFLKRGCRVTVGREVRDRRRSLAHCQDLWMPPHAFAQHSAPHAPSLLEASLPKGLLQAQKRYQLPRGRFPPSSAKAIAAQCYTGLLWLYPPFLHQRMVPYAMLHLPVFGDCRLLRPRQ